MRLDDNWDDVMVVMKVDDWVEYLVAAKEHVLAVSLAALSVCLMGKTSVEMKVSL